MKHIFPKEIIENTVEVYRSKHRKRSRVIYSLVLLFMIGGLVVLPFINVTIYNTSQGMLRSEEERVLLRNMVNGEVRYQKLRNNLQVQKGDTLLIVDNTAINQKIKSNAWLIKEVEDFINDLKKLLERTNRNSPLITSKYKEALYLYGQRIKELRLKEVKLRLDFIRDEKLYKKGVIAEVDFNESRLQYNLAKSASVQAREQQKNSWITELTEYENQLKELQNIKEDLVTNRQLTIIKAPVDGTIFNVKGLKEGAFISAGVEVAEISPSSNLVVTSYVKPSDIGLIHKGDKATFQISAFNYQQWGLATGSIIDIGNDVEVIKDMPVFRVTCSIDQPYLKLKNGFKGYLKKGMTLQARFELTERSLFDLLYDKVDDWVNPTAQNNSTKLTSI